MINRIIVSAPFGNRMDIPNTTPTLGTFTLEYRGSTRYQIWRVLKTVRYYPGIGAWKNKLGLPNPSIYNLRDDRVHRSIVSISARKTQDWITLINILSSLVPLAVELNVSCPNCPNEIDQSDYFSVFDYAKHRFKEVIVKLPPLHYEEYVSKAAAADVRSFHCCNTIPIGNSLGGLSGKPLKPFSLAAIKYIRGQPIKIDRIIGGGGVTSPDDIEDYLRAEATNVAIASFLFNPFNRRKVKKWAT